MAHMALTDALTFWMASGMVILYERKIQGGQGDKRDEQEYLSQVTEQTRVLPVWQFAGKIFKNITNTHVKTPVFGNRQKKMNPMAAACLYWKLNPAHQTDMTSFGFDRNRRNFLRVRCRNIIPLND